MDAESGSSVSRSLFFTGRTLFVCSFSVSSLSVFATGRTVGVLVSLAVCLRGMRIVSPIDRGRSARFGFSATSSSRLVSYFLVILYRVSPFSTVW